MIESGESEREKKKLRETESESRVIREKMN